MHTCIMKLGQKLHHFCVSLCYNVIAVLYKCYVILFIVTITPCICLLYTTVDKPLYKMLAKHCKLFKINFIDYVAGI